jgi:hypothetical protein
VRGRGDKNLVLLREDMAEASEIQAYTKPDVFVTAARRAAFEVRGSAVPGGAAPRTAAQKPSASSPITTLPAVASGRPPSWFRHFLRSSPVYSSILHQSTRHGSFVGKH